MSFDVSLDALLVLLLFKDSTGKSALRSSKSDGQRCPSS